jgi:HK97 family phage major capsid protein
MTILELQQKKGELVKQARDISNKSEADKRKLTGQEREHMDAAFAEVDSIDAQIDDLRSDEKRNSRLNELDAEMSKVERRSAPAPIDNRHNPNEAITREFTGRCGITRKYEVEPRQEAYERCNDDYSANYRHYLNTGNVRNLMQSENTKGGYLAPMEIFGSIISKLDDALKMRQISTVHTISGAKSLGIPTIDTDPSAAAWTPEVPSSDISADSTMAFGQRELMPHLDTKRIDVSRVLLRNAAQSVETIVSDRLAYKLGLAQEVAFLTGSGTNQPEGVFTNTDVGTVTAAGADSENDFDADDVVNTLYELKSQYHGNATFGLHRSFLKQIRRLKDANNQWLWSAGLTGGQPSQILGHNYFISENAPSTATTGQDVLIVGDFSFYHIVDSMDLEIQVADQIQAGRNLIAYFARSMTDGMIIHAEAFKKLQIA